MLGPTIVLALLALAHQATAACNTPWVSFGNSCYLYVGKAQSNLTWNEARQTCVAFYNADLVSILSANEQTVVANMMSQHQETNPIWIGLSDRQVEGVFQWSDGSGNMTSGGLYKNWVVGEPNNAQNEDCGVMTTQGLWNDVACAMQLGYICKRSTATTLPSPFQVGNFTIATSADCGGWYSHLGYCYQYNSTAVTFTQAEMTCFKQGAILVSILSTAELNYLKTFITKQRTKSFYIGLNDRLIEGTYVWDDGTTTGTTGSITNWGQGEPNDNKHSEDCAEFLPTHYWNDIPCSTKRAYMCKRQANANATWNPVTNPKRTKCPAHYATFKHPTNGATYCYRMIGNSYNQRKTWYQARTACRSSGKGFDLASIHDHYESNFILSLFAKQKLTFYYFWTGLNDRTSEGGYIWSDGTPTDYVLWSSGQPNNLRGRQDCTEMYRSGGRWNDNGCSSRNAYACKYTLVPRAKKGGTPSVTTKFCQNGWRQYQSYCYYVNSSASLTHGQAVAACNGMAANLTSINSYGEQSFIMAHLGLNNASARVHIGINDIKREGEFGWTDGSMVTYTNWGYNQPNDWRRKQDCTELDHTLGYWNDLNCNVRRGYVCKKLRSTNTNPAQASNSCPPGWQWFKSRCYLFMNNKLTQDAAEASCMKQKNQYALPGHLATISSRYVNFFISSLITANATTSTPAPPYVWFGLNDNATENTYAYTSNMPVTYANWASGQPNDWHHAQDCVDIMTATGQWNDITCSLPQPYICSIYDNTYKQVPPPPTLPAAGSSTAPCPPGWVKYNTRCYGFFGNINKHTLNMSITSTVMPISPLAWTDAVTSCQSMGAQLVSIPSNDVQNFLTQTAAQDTKWSYFWTGLNDRGDEGGYVWVDGTPVSYTNWSPQQPNDWNGQQDCVYVILAPDGRTVSHPNMWNDLSCSNEMTYVCEFPAGKQMPVATAPPSVPPQGMKQIGCPAGWTSTYRNCYQVQDVTNKRNTWSNAERKCKAMQATLQIPGVQPHLASIHSPKDHLVLAQMLIAATGNNPNVNNTQFWSGLADKTKEGTYNWTDNSTYNYQGWSAGQPNNWRAQQDCVEIRMDTGYLWNDQSCSNVLPYICGFSRFVPSNTGQPTPPPPYSNLKCADGWMKFQGSCYREFSSPRMDYDTAYMNCSTQGGDLLIVNSKEEQAFVTSQVTSGAISEYVWIGLTDEDHERYFRWADGSYLRGYTRWGPGQPNNINNEDCVAIHSSDSMWYDRDCSEPHSFVCEASIFTFNISSVTATPNAQGSKGHLSVGGEVGIAIAVLIAIGVIGAVVFIAMRRRGSAFSPGPAFSPVNVNDDDDDDALLADEEE